MRFLSGKKIVSQDNKPCEYQRETYSQFGEDLIIDQLFSILINKKLINTVSYLEIGGFDPYFFSNTFLFYSRGYSGVVIEPNRILAEKFMKTRTRDVVLNIGIDIDSSVMKPFYQFNIEAFGLSTFCKDSAELSLKKCDSAHKYDVIMTPVMDINSVVSNYFNDKALTFISLDIEGNDFKILESFDFTHYRPHIWIIETAELSQSSFLGKKNLKIQDYMLQNDYLIYADTYINTIFVDRNILEKAY
jgi:hypothetical protein